MPLALRLVPTMVALELAVLAAWWHPALIPLSLLISAAALWRPSRRGIPRWIAIGRDWRRRRALNRDLASPDEVLDRVLVRSELDGAGETVAVLEDGLGAVALLAVDPTGLVRRIDPDRSDGRAGARASGGTGDPAWAVIADLLGDPVRPAAVQVVRTSNDAAWIAVRVDPGRSADAVARRGGGTTGCRRALLAVASRAILRLGDAGLSVRMLKPDEARAVLRGVSCAPGLSGASENWHGWRGPAGAVRYWLADGPTVHWSSVTLTPTAEPGARSGSKAGTVACRVIRVGDSVPEAVPLDGQHGLALLAAAPLAWDAGVLGRAKAVDAGALGRLGPVVRGAGIPLGVDADSLEVHARVHRSAAISVALVGDSAIGRLLVRRAPCRTVIVTARPEVWAGLPLSAAIVDPADAFEHPGDPTTPGLVVWDRISPAARPAWCTVVELIEDLTPSSATALRAADLVLAHGMGPEQAGIFATALNLSARQAHWLAHGPEDGLAVVEGDGLTFLALGTDESDFAGH